MMKKVFRCLAVVAMVVGCMVVALKTNSGECISYYELTEEEKEFLRTNTIHYELTEEELNFLYRMTYAEAMPTRSHFIADAVIQRMPRDNYYPSDEERQLAYLMAYAQTHDEEPIIQTMGTNVAINIAKEEGMNLIDVFTFPNLFSGMCDGVPSIINTNEDGKLEWIPVTDDMLTDELKEAVDLAFEQDFTEGAMHYYNSYSNSKDRMPEEFIQKGDWIFFKEF